MNDWRKKLAALLLAKSYLEKDVVLTSGKRSNYYFDCKQTALHPEGAFLIGSLFVEMLRNEQIHGVAGMTLGADPLVTATSLMGRMQGFTWPAMIVRKESKGHGTNSYLEGVANFQPGDRVAVLEDVATTGGSALRACQRLADAGYKVVRVCCILDREEGAADALSAADLPFNALFTRSQLFHEADS
ncbi:orotate phosphoribosyltransferase [Desulfonatronum thiosulfatophilum]|uniref:Orotate phosphoribosyltransferase n=1 Tax=Desulfonatronum thiosulfatophilum TaxID=617002 RepID=A0A1G6AZM3_9BACT|nr:orotate phosphoribosyltransferase [Desulfonatronum thiosulfatophilum]SDB13795.1 orotate phosphoribosyltransferase [Desulfonatronum thiosulfatophilum]